MTTLRRGPVWGMFLPLAVISWLAAHSLAYRLVAPDAKAHEHLLAQTGHAYLAYAPHLLALCLALVLAGFAGLVLLSVRGRHRLRVGSRQLIPLPALAFVVQEHLERLLQHGSFPVDAALEPTFLLGLLLQLPVAVGALVLARALLSLGAALGQVLRVPWGPWPRLAPVAPPLVLRARRPPRPRLPLLASGHGPRGPPGPSRSS